MRTVFGLLLIAGFCAALCPADSVYAVTEGQYFGTLDLTTGVFQRIGPDLPEPSSGLVAAPNGSFLSLGFSGNLNLIDPATGVTTVIGPTGLGDCSGPSSPCAPNAAYFLTQFHGTYYATDVSNNLYRVNPANAAATLLGPSGLPPTPFKLDAMNPDGTTNIADETLFVVNSKLYATYDAGTIDFSTGNITQGVEPALYQLDVASGTASRIGPTDFGLFMAIQNSGGVIGYDAVQQGLVSLDLATGSTRFLTGVDPSLGFIIGAAQTPEPGTVALFGIGLFAFLFWRRKGKMAVLAASVAAMCFLTVPMRADSFPIVYSFTGSSSEPVITGTTATLNGLATGPFMSSNADLNAAWNPVTVSDRSVVDLTTGVLNGSAALTFENGDVLFAHLTEDVSAVLATFSGPFTQTLTFTGGTGAFAGATGSITGSGIVASTGFTTAGSGTLDAPAVPEPGTIMLLSIGLFAYLIWRCKRASCAIAALCFCAGISIAGTKAQAQDEGRDSRSPENLQAVSVPIEGTWIFNIHRVSEGVTFSALQSFAGGGVTLATGTIDRTPPPPISPLYGSWKRIGHNRYVATICFFVFDPAGTAVALIKAQESFQLVNEDNLKGSAIAFACDVNGENCVDANLPSTITGKRLVAKGVPE